MSTVSYLPAMPARSPVAEWQVAHFPAPLKYSAPAFASPVRMSCTVKTAAPRSVSFNCLRRKCAMLVICSSLSVDAGLPLCSGCPFFRNGPISLPYRSRRNRTERRRFGPLSVPRPCAPWHVTHSATQTSLPLSASAKSTSGLSAGPAAPPPPPPPRDGGG